MGLVTPIKSKKEIKQLKKYFLKGGKIRNCTLFVFGINTALRISDILSLKWNDVYDFETDTVKTHVTLTEQKTRKINSVHINSHVKKAILKLLRHNYSKNMKVTAADYIFTSQKSRSSHLSRAQAFRIIRAAAEHLHINGNIGCHSMRKTFGYFASKSRISPNLIMSIYNHSTYSVTRHYLGIDQDERDFVFKAITL